MVPLQVIARRPGPRRGRGHQRRRRSPRPCGRRSPSPPPSVARGVPAAYTEAAEGGADAARVGASVGRVSGTYESARLAAREARSRWTSSTRAARHGTGFALRRLPPPSTPGGRQTRPRRRRGRGRGDHEPVLRRHPRAPSPRRSGRRGSALVGSALAVKPLLRLDDGRLESLDRVRTTERALARLLDVAIKEAGVAEVDLAVHHLAVPLTRAGDRGAAAGAGAWAAGTYHRRGGRGRGRSRWPRHGRSGGVAEALTVHRGSLLHRAQPERLHGSHIGLAVQIAVARPTGRSPALASGDAIPPGRLRTVAAPCPHSRPIRRCRRGPAPR